MKKKLIILVAILALSIIQIGSLPLSHASKYDEKQRDQSWREFGYGIDGEGRHVIIYDDTRGNFRFIYNDLPNEDCHGRGCPN